MKPKVIIHNIGPATTLQDMGRPGYLAYGLTRGGAADPLALHEAAALLGQSPDCAAFEMVGTGGSFEMTQDTIIALTGAVMDAKIDGVGLTWNATHVLPAGARLIIGGTRAGNYGYLSVAGGVDAPAFMGARATHLNAGIGTTLSAGAALPLGQSAKPEPGNTLLPDNRLSGGIVRIVPSMQTDQFSEDTRNRFVTTTFQRDPRANRMGVRMDQPGEGFSAADTLSIVSEVIVPGDIQITGDGAPFVLMCECQTTGGYPRIGTVIPSDLPKIAQAPAGAEIRFQFVTRDEAVDIERRARVDLKKLSQRVHPLIRDPHKIQDLLSYQLISGAISASADPFVS